MHVEKPRKDEAAMGTVLANLEANLPADKLFHIMHAEGTDVERNEKVMEAIKEGFRKSATVCG